MQRRIKWSSDDAPPPIQNTGRDDVLAAIRELFRADPAARTREGLLTALREHLGYGSLGKTIREILSGDIKAAVRRGILDNTGGEYRPHCRTIDEYEPAFLRQMFLAALADGRDARVWMEQADALRWAARYLGFKNTGPRIQQAFKNAIRALIRANELEREGDRIRRTK